MKSHDFGEGDNFCEGLSLGVWDEEFGYYKPKTPTGEVSDTLEVNLSSDIIIPKLGEVALLLGLSVPDANADENPLD